MHKFQKGNYLQVSSYLLFIFLISFTQSFAGQQTIQGKIDSVDGPKKIILYEFYGSQTIPIDSVEIKGGDYKFKFKDNLPRGFYSLGFAPGDSRVFISANESIEINGTKGQMASAKISNSKEQEIFEAYQDIVRTANNGFQGLNQRVTILRPLQASDPKKFNEGIEGVRKTYDSLINWQNNSYAKLAKENPESFTGKICSFFMKKEIAAAGDYFDVTKLNDEELLRGDMVKSKLNIYFQQVIGGDINAWKNVSRELIKTDIDNPNGKEILYCSIIEIFAQADAEFAGSIAKSFKAEFPESSFAKVYYSAFPQGPPEVGDMAPDIALVSPEGEPMKLSSLKGQLVLLDFWASWCGPCRRENPNVVRAYKTYNEDGFTVFSVSLDNNKEKWVGAIVNDGLEWPNHVSDLKGWQSAGAALYGVRSIPATFLVGPDGKILAKNLRGARLEEKIKEILEVN